jgi:hypothetical protein
MNEQEAPKAHLGPYSPLAVGSTPDGSRGSPRRGQPSADFSPHYHATPPHNYTQPPAQKKLNKTKETQ